MQRHAPFAAMVIAVCAATAALAQSTNVPVIPKPGARVPAHPNKEFAPWELLLRLPARLKDNAPYESAPFYAVVLKRFQDTPCDGGEFSKSVEVVRSAAQQRFPGAKVFADQQCPDMGAVYYKVDGTAEGMSFGAFVAVYAGKTEREARAVLAKAKSAYPGATVKRVRVGFSRIVQ